MSDILAFSPDLIPAAMRSRRRWIEWRREAPPGRDKPTKVPYIAGTQCRQKAKSDDPKTWRAFDEALTAHRRGKSDGIGFMLGADDDALWWSGADLDDCMSEAGVEPDALGLLHELDSYSEVSPSGHGVKVIMRSSRPLPSGRRRGHTWQSGRAGAIEMYSDRRFFAITGRRFNGTPLAVEERTDVLHNIYARVFASRERTHGREPPRERSPLGLDDFDLLDLAFAAANGPKFRRLWLGDTSGYTSCSEADLALCSMLAFWTGRDAGRMDRLFRRSGLMRRKWDERHGSETYGAMTVGAAINGTSETYSPPIELRIGGQRHNEKAKQSASNQTDGAGATSEAAAFTPPSHWKFYDLADLEHWEVEPFEPIVDSMYARGNLVLEVAATQTGKSLKGIYEARMLVTGGKLFGRYDVTPVDRVLYIVLEDPARRFHARGMDMAHEFGDLERGRCVFLVAPGFRIDDDAMFLWLGETVRSYGEGHTVVFLDTYQKATPGIASFDDEKQSLILHRLAGLTRSLECTLIVKDHFRKTASNGRHRGEVTLDDIKGTGGKAQNADCVILMERTADRRQIKLQTFSKDFDEPVRILLDVAPKGSTEPKFSYAGDLDKLGQSSSERGEANRMKILGAMEPGEWYSSADLAAATRLNKATVCRHLDHLIDTAAVTDNDATGKGRRYWRTGSSHRNGPNATNA